MVTLDEKSSQGLAKKPQYVTPHPLSADFMGTLLTLISLPSRPTLPSLPSLLLTKATSTAVSQQHTRDTHRTKKKLPLEVSFSSCLGSYWSIGDRTFSQTLDGERREL